jgi:dUTPase
MLTNAAAEPFKLSHGDKIAQFSVEQVLPTIINEVYNQEDVYQAESLRISGLGSTGD